MFPLLRLPSLAQYEVIKNMELYRILLLTQYSRRAKNLVQKQRIPIELKVDYDVEKKFLKFRKHENPDDMIAMYISKFPLDSCGTWKIGDQVVPVITRPKSWCSYWQNESAGLKLFLEFFKSNFIVKNVSCDFEMIDPEDGIKALEHSKTLGLNFGVVEFRSEECDANLAKKVFDMCANAETFKFLARTPNDFNYENFNKFSMNTLTLYNDPHVTIDDISALNRVQSVTLKFVKFSSLELNQILKNWMSGVVNFKQLCLVEEADRIESGVILDGLNAVEQPDKSYEVQRGDGIIGNLNIYVRGVHLVVQN